MKWNRHTHYALPIVNARLRNSDPCFFLLALSVGNDADRIDSEDDQRDPFDQGVPHRINAYRHQFNAIMEGHELCACEKNVALLEIFHLDLDRFDHLTRIVPSYLPFHGF